MHFNVRRIQQVRIKIADVEADSHEEALHKTQAVDLRAALDRDGLDIPLSMAGPQAYAQAIALHGDAPIMAMVELAQARGGESEHRFDYDAAAGAFRRAGFPKDLSTLEPDAPLAFLAKLKVISGESEDHVSLLLVARSTEHAWDVLDEVARTYYGENEDDADDDEKPDSDPPYHFNGGQMGVAPHSVDGISPTIFHALKRLLMVRSQEGCPEPLAIDRAQVAASIPQITQVLEVAAAGLSALADQVGQMRGMFNDDDDSSIEEAVDAGEEAEEAIRRLRAALTATAPAAPVPSANIFLNDPVSATQPIARPRGGC